MTVPAVSGPATPTFPAGVVAAMADLGVDLTGYPSATTIDGFVADVGEPAFAWLVLLLEAELPEPFPEELLEQIDTLDDLAWFTGVKRSHTP